MRRERFFAVLRMTVWASAMIALASCSVKEDRTDCPCWLTVRASYPNEAVSAWYGTHMLFDGLMGQQVDRQVPRGSVDVLASCGSFTVHVGEQMDELFASIVRVDTQGETAEIIPKLNKQFARVYLEFKESDEGRVEHTLVVEGNVKGADKRTLQPVTGPFRCTPTASSGRGYEVNVPRQKDDSLVLRQYDEDGVEFSPIPIGQIIRKAGFDWTQESLGDVSIIADIPESTFLITITDWDGVSMTVKI